LKIYSTEKDVLVVISRLNESFHLATVKVEFGTGQRGKQRGIPKEKEKDSSKGKG